MMALDFFCGAGGMTRGFLNMGIEVRAGIDWNESCKRTYESNNRPARFISGDLRFLQGADIAPIVSGIPREGLIFMGCAPCQPFSKQRREVNRSGGTLLERFGRLVDEFRPGYVIVENVPGIAKVPGNSTYRRFLKRLGESGYRFVDGQLDAKWFGVPQTRNRWVVVASRNGVPSFPARTHGPGLIRFVTVRDVISSYPRLAAGEQSVSVPNHRAAKISNANLERLAATPLNGGGRMDWPERLVLECHKRYEGHTDVYGRMRWDAPAPTLTCRCFSLSNGRYGHPEQQRAISLREAAKLQSFDDAYVFFGKTQAAIGAQIGNAVPVKLAEALARTVLADHVRLGFTVTESKMTA
jgi:DNA (cytosine-5)-methyltransferase 1